MTNNNTLLSHKRKRLLFYCAVMFIPIIQVLIFYFYINFRSFGLGFFEYQSISGKYAFIGFENFKQIFVDFKEKAYMMNSIYNALELFVYMFIFGSLFAVLFSYYIYKRHPLSGLFKIILYAPQIISGMVFVIMFKFFVTSAVPKLWLLIFGKKIEGLLDSPATLKTTIIFFNVWMSFGTQVLIYSNSMSGVSDSVIESGQLDGASPLRELISIVIPSIWSTFVTFMLLRVVGLFTDQMSLYSFFGGSADYSLYTFGYYLFKETAEAEGYLSTYPYLSAFGLLLTVVAVPLTLLVKWALEKYGPKTE